MVYGFDPDDGARIGRLSYKGMDLLTTPLEQKQVPAKDYGKFETRPVYGYDDSHLFFIPEFIIFGNMAGTVLHIKNMVCPRCIKTVREEMQKLGFTVERVELGLCELAETTGSEDLEKIGRVLKENGFELLYDKKKFLADNIKTTIIEIIHYGKEVPGYVKISDFIARELGYDYSYLSSLFSSVTGTTIEKYIVKQKIEKAKELLSYDELSLTEISYQLDYSSVQHLSNQFKKVTGLTPSQFKKQTKNKRNSLDKV